MVLWGRFAGSRLIGLILALLVVCAGAAHGAERARQQTLGFSPDGLRFAFIQWGVGDGLGDPYADVFVLDVPSNSWLSGSPIRIRVPESEVDALWNSTDDPAQWAYDQALAEAQPLLEASGIVRTDTGTMLVRRTVFDRSAPADMVRFTVAPNSVRDYTIRLTQDQIDNDCDYMDRQPRIFSLILESSSNPPLTLQEDTGLPESRGCALGYRIHDVIMHRETFDGPASLVVLLAYSLPGFEGDDIRYLAVSARTTILEPF
ncbi:MAG: DUF2259 domain-containing protein [Azospirillaceae bacterium]